MPRVTGRRPAQRSIYLQIDRGVTETRSVPTPRELPHCTYHPYGSTAVRVRAATLGHMLSQLDLYGQKASEISSSIERAIRDGSLSPGDQLPTIRLLASDLAVSPTTVAAAYRQLRQRGIVTTYGRGGTRVHPRPPIEFPETTELPEDLADLISIEPDSQLIPTRGHLFSRLGKLAPTKLDNAELHDLLAKDFTVDNIPEGVIALADSPNAAITGLLATRHRPGDRVALEDPCNPEVLDILTSLGLLGIGLAMDERGVLPSSLEHAISKSTSTALMTPRGQLPTGASFSIDRAADLDRVINVDSSTCIIEMDPLGAIAGSQYQTSISHNRHPWAVIRSFGMSLGSDLNLTAIIGDPETISRFRGRQSVIGGTITPLLQQILLECIQEPDTHRTVTLASRTYAARRITLLAELRNRGIEATSGSGVSIWLPVRREKEVVETMAERGWAISAGSRSRIDSSPGVRIICNRLMTDDARHFADDLLESLAN